MGQTLITAGATLLALIVGVLIEPFKNTFSHKARIRQLRAERCEELIRTAIAQHEAKMEMRVHFSKSARPVYPVTVESAKAAIEAIEDLSGKVLALAGVIHLYGPQELGESAFEFASGIGVQESYKLTSQAIDDEFEQEIQESTLQFRHAMEKFVLVARKYITK